MASAFTPSAPLRRVGQLLCHGLMATLLLHGASRPAFAKKEDKWHEARSAHFLVLSNGGKKKARKVAEEFERIRALFRIVLFRLDSDPAKPVIVLAAKNEKTLRTLIPYYWEEENRVRPAGVFSTSPYHHHIVLRTDARGEHRYSTIYHEYFHLLTELNMPLMPIWLNEGLAEFVETATIRGRTAKIGLLSRYLSLLRKSELLPFETLLSVDRSSPHYNERDRVSLFYAQSWAFVHYAFLGDETGQMSEAISKYLYLTDEGIDAKEAAVEAFGDLAELEEQLRNYIMKRWFQGFKIKLSTALEKPNVEVRELPPAEWLAHQATFFAHRSREKSRQLLKESLAQDPKSAMANELMGTFLLQDHKYADAAERFRSAIAVDSQRYLSNFLLAAALESIESEQDTSSQQEAHLAQAIGLNPRFAPGYRRLSWFYEMRDPDLRRAIPLATKAVEHEPHSVSHRLNVARLIQESGSPQRAEEVAEISGKLAISQGPVAGNNYCWYATLEGFARVALPACEYAVQAKPDNGGYRDSRGLARALTGDLTGALDDFRAFVQSIEEDGERPEQIEARIEWIEALEAGLNPINDQVLRDLRERKY